MHNNVILQIVRSTSDHIAWIFLDMEDNIHNKGNENKDDQKNTWASLFDDHYMTIKKYVDAYVTHEDIAILVPSYQALLRINFHNLQHVVDEQMMDSVLNLPSAVLLETPSHHYSFDTGTFLDISKSSASAASTPADARNAVIFGCVLQHMISYALSTGLYYGDSRYLSSSRRPKFYRVLNDFFKHLHMTPFWDHDAYYFEPIDGKQFKHYRHPSIISNNYDSVCTFYSLQYDSS